jgi:hypothetical protein
MNLAMVSGGIVHISTRTTFFVSGGYTYGTRAVQAHCW